MDFKHTPKLQTKEGRRDASERVQKIYKKLAERSRTAEEVAPAEDLLPKLTINGDGDSINDQLIDIIDEGERVSVTFKMPTDKWLELIKRMKEEYTLTGDNIRYSGHKFNFTLSAAYRLNSGSFRIYIAKEPQSNGVKSSYGLIRIETGKAIEDITLHDPDNDIHSFGTAEELLHFSPAPQSADEEISEDYWLNDNKFSVGSHGIDPGIINWPPAVFSTDKAISYELSVSYENFRGMKYVPDKDKHRPVIGVHSTRNDHTYMLFADDPAVQDFLGLKEGDKKTKETLTDEYGDKMAVEKGVNYFKMDLTIPYTDDAGRKFRIIGYSTDNIGGIRAVIKDEASGSLKRIGFHELRKFKKIGKEQPTTKNGEELSQELQEIMSKVLGIKDALLTPDEEIEREYKLTKYKWANKLTSIPKENEENVLSRLKRVDVMPGYSTIVEDGRVEQIEKIGPFFLYHTCYVLSGRAPVMIPKMIRSGLLCTHERFRRGLNVSGMSSSGDLGGGGGDNVYLRMWGDKDRSSYLDTMTMSGLGGNLLLIFNKSILNRQDYFCYPSDSFGSTGAQVLNSRITSAELLQQQMKLGFRQTNELIFQHGISFNNVDFIAAGTKEMKQELINVLTDSNINEINGQPVDDFIKVTNSYLAIAEITNPDLKERMENARVEAKKKAEEETKKMTEKQAALKLETNKALMAKFKVGQSVAFNADDYTTIYQGQIKSFDADYTAVISLSNGKIQNVPLKKLADASISYKIGDVVTPINGDINVPTGSKWKVMKFIVEYNNNLYAQVQNLKNPAYVLYHIANNLTLDKPMTVEEKPIAANKFEELSPLKFKIGDIVIGNDLNKYPYTSKGVTCLVNHINTKFGQVRLKILDGPPKNIGLEFWVNKLGQFDLVEK